MAEKANYPEFRVYQREGELSSLTDKVQAAFDATMELNGSNKLHRHRSKDLKEKQFFSSQSDDITKVLNMLTTIQDLLDNMQDKEYEFEAKMNERKTDKI